MGFSVMTVVLLACRPQPGDGTPQDSMRETDDSTPTDDSTSDDSGADDSATEDRDGDGWIEPDDCDEGDETIYPSAPEACVDHKDNDCDGVVDHCDLARDPNVDHRFLDPDANGWKTNGQIGFGSAMAFLDKDSPGLWISPQALAKEPIWRKAGPSGWSPAQISGFDTFDIDDRSLPKVETGGDFDLDGSPDLILAQGKDTAFTAYLFYDPVVATQSLDAASATVTANGLVDTWAYWHMTAIGDQTGDGAEDLLLGWHEAESWILAGPIVGDLDVSKDDASVATTVAEVWSGTGLDFDGDGTRDLATTNPFDTATAIGTLGAAYVYLGPPASNLEPAVADRGWHGADGVGGEQAGAGIKSGDLDGDGRDELIVRSWGFHIYSQPGAVYVVDYDAPDSGELQVAARAQIQGNAFDHLGDTSGDVADFDHDGRADLVVSSLQHYADDKGDGYVSVFLGPLDGHLVADSEANLTLRGSENDYGPGFTTVAGHLDDEGELQLAVGSIIFDDNGYLMNAVDIVTPALLFSP
jgi:hypothetical protein